MSRAIFRRHWRRYPPHGWARLDFRWGLVDGGGLAPTFAGSGRPRLRGIDAAPVYLAAYALGFLLSGARPPERGPYR